MQKMTLNLQKTHLLPHACVTAQSSLSKEVRLHPIHRPLPEFYTIMPKGNRHSGWNGGFDYSLWNMGSRFSNVQT